MLTRATRRRGFSLTEVLIAIFVMSIGLISLLVLFPFGAIQMATAIKDDRTAMIADNAAASANLFWKQAWVQRDLGVRAVNEARNEQRFIGAMQTNPYTAFYFGANLAPGTWPPVAPTPWPPADTDWNTGTVPNPPAPAPSARTFYPPVPPADPLSLLVTDPSTQDGYPVLVDPVGFFAHDRGSPRLNFGTWWLAGEAGQRRVMRWTLNEFLPSRDLSAGINQASILRYCSFADDLNFRDSGTAMRPGGVVERGNFYNWAFLVRRKGVTASGMTMRLWILVYQRRAIDIPNEETAVAARMRPGNPLMRLILPASGAQPPLRKGAWVLNVSSPNNRSRVCTWHRILNVNEVGVDDGSGGFGFASGRPAIDVEVDPPPGIDIDPSMPPNNRALPDPVDPNQGGMVYIFDTLLQGKLIEVFDRGEITISSKPVGND